MYKIGFVIEQAYGHITHGQNLRKIVSEDPEVEAHWVLPEWQKSGVATKILGYKTVNFVFQVRSQIRELQRNVSLDGLFFHTQAPAVFSQDWMRRIPSVVSLDATPLQYDRLGSYYKHGAGPSWLEKKKYQLNVSCLQKARHLVAWSSWTKEGLIEEYQVDADRISVIPPGVNCSEWKLPFSNSPSSPNNTVKILFVGGNLERKGGKDLLEVYRSLRQQFSESSLANDRETSIELHLVTRDSVAPELGVFVYNDLLPNSPELRALFHQCQIFCLPSYGDFLPMVLLEAGAVGMPSITTGIAAIPEIIRDGFSGFLVSPGDVEGLQVALRKLVTNPMLRKELGDNAQTLVSTTFDAKKNAQKLLALLKYEIKKAA